MSGAVRSCTAAKSSRHSTTRSSAPRARAARPRRARQQAGLALLRAGSRPEEVRSDASAASRRPGEREPPREEPRAREEPCSSKARWRWPRSTTRSPGFARPLRRGRRSSSGSENCRMAPAAKRWRAPKPKPRSASEQVKLGGERVDRYVLCGWNRRHGARCSRRPRSKLSQRASPSSRSPTPSTPTSTCSFRKTELTRRTAEQRGQPWWSMTAHPPCAASSRHRASHRVYARAISSAIANEGNSWCGCGCASTIPKKHCTPACPRS